MSITSKSFLLDAKKTEILIHPSIRSCHVRSGQVMSSHVKSCHVMSCQVQASGLTFQKQNRQKEGRPPYLWPQRSRRLEWRIPQGWPRPPLPGSEYGVLENISHRNIFNISRKYFHPCASRGQPLCLCIVIRSHWNLDCISCVCCQNLTVTSISLFWSIGFFFTIARPIIFTFLSSCGVYLALVFPGHPLRHFVKPVLFFPSTFFFIFWLFFILPQFAVFHLFEISMEHASATNTTKRRETTKLQLHQCHTQKPPQSLTFYKSTWEWEQWWWSHDDPVGPPTYKRFGSWTPSWLDAKTTLVGVEILEDRSACLQKTRVIVWMSDIFTFKHPPSFTDQCFFASLGKFFWYFGLYLFSHRSPGTV